MIRPATIDDLKYIVKIEEDCFNDPWDEDIFRYYLLLNPFAITFVAMEDYKIVGYIIGEIADNTQICSYGVLNEYQRRGIGSQLMDALLKESTGDITLEVRVSNDKAINVYKKYGFEIVRTLPHFYEDNGEDAYYMIKARKGK